MTRAARSLVLVPAAAACALLTACGGSSHSAKQPSGAATATATAGPSGVQQVTVDANADLRFQPSVIVAHPGKLKITVVNTEKPGDGPPHNLELPTLGSEGITNVNAGQSATVTLNLGKPGTYKFVCTYHESSGMVGTLRIVG